MWKGRGDFKLISGAGIPSMANRFGKNPGYGYDSYENAELELT